MGGTDYEHRTEIRRARRTMPMGVALLVGVAVVVAFVVGSSGGESNEEDARRPQPRATDRPAQLALAPVFGITGSAGDLRPISTAVGSEPDPANDDEIQLGPSAPIVTAGRVLVLDQGGALHVGAPGGSFSTLACCFDEIHPSNEPDHVWLRTDHVVDLLDLDAPGSDRTVLLDIGDATVLGPASFGVVTRDDRDVVRWHRPSFEPTVLRASPVGRAIDAGGDRLLVAAPADAEGRGRLEVWSITGDGLLSTLRLDRGAASEGVLAPDGSVLLVPAPGGSDVRDAVTGLLHGSLPEVSRPVWVGGNRFAATLDGQLVVSDRGVLPMRWAVRAVAEQSP